jgi:hypothetical protein
LFCLLTDVSHHKKIETLHHALRTMMHAVSCHFFPSNPLNWLWSNWMYIVWESAYHRTVRLRLMYSTQGLWTERDLHQLPHLLWHSLVFSSNGSSVGPSESHQLWEPQVILMILEATCIHHQHYSYFCETIWFICSAISVKQGII